MFPKIKYKKSSVDISMKMKRNGPDSVNSWMMVSVCVFLSMIIYAVVRMSSVMFVASMIMFDVDRQSASMPYILTDFVQAISSPLTGYLTHKYGVRLVMVSGGLLSAIGIGACFFAKEIGTVTIFWGVVLGIGFGLTVPLLAVVVTQHFVKKRAIAMGIVYVGGFFGCATLPGIAEYLISYYGLSGTFLCISGLVLHCIPLSMLLRHPNVSKNTLRHNHPEKRTSSEIEFRHIPIATIQSQYEEHQNIFKDTCIIKNTPQTDYNDPKLKASKGFVLESNPKVGTGNTHVTSKVIELNNLSENCYRSVKHFSNEFQNCKSNFKTVNAPGHSEKYEITPGAQQPFQTNVKSTVFRRMDELELVVNPEDNRLYTKADNSIPPTIQQNNSARSLGTFKVFLEPAYIVVLITEAMYEGSSIAFWTIIVVFSRDVGLPLEHGEYVILAYCIASSVGLLSFGWVTDNGHMTCTSFSGLLFVLRCITTIIISYSNGLVFLLLAVLLYGLFESPLSNMFPLIIADYFKKEVHEVAISCRLFLCAPVYLVTPTLIGYFRDYLGSYFYFFCLLSSCSLFSGFLLFLTPQLAKFRCGRDETVLRDKNSG